MFGFFAAPEDRRRDCPAYHSEPKSVRWHASCVTHLSGPLPPPAAVAVDAGERVGMKTVPSGTVNRTVYPVRAGWQVDGFAGSSRGRQPATRPHRCAAVPAALGARPSRPHPIVRVPAVDPRVAPPTPGFTPKWGDHRPGPGGPRSPEIDGSVRARRGVRGRTRRRAPPGRPGRPRTQGGQDGRAPQGGQDGRASRGGQDGRAPAPYRRR